MTPWAHWTSRRPWAVPALPMAPVPMEFHYVFISVLTLIVALLGGHAARRFADVGGTSPFPVTAGQPASSLLGAGDA